MDNVTKETCRICGDEAYTIDVFGAKFFYCPTCQEGARRAEGDLCPNGHEVTANQVEHWRRRLHDAEF